MFKVCFFSCEVSNSYNPGINRLIAENPDIVFSQGDNPYMNSSPSNWGYTTTAVDKNSTQQDFEDHYNLMLNKPEWLNLLASGADVYLMADDREWGGDNWDHTIVQANTGTGISAVTQADVDTHWKRGNDAAIAITAAHFSNVSNTDTEAVAEKPSEADALAANYPVKYFRVGYDVNGAVSASPLVEFFVIDCISYRSPVADVDNAAKTMLGKGTGGGRDTDGQYYWLIEKLKASTATFKVIVSSKKTYRASTGDNGDTFGVYSTELDLIIDAIDTNSITGVLWIAGDKHRPSVTNTATAGSANNVDHCCIVACPMGVDLNAEMTLDNGHIWQGDYQNYGVLEITASKISVIIRSTLGDDLWRGELLAGANILTYPELQVAI